MNEREALKMALELLAVGTFYNPELQAKRTEIIEIGLEALAKPENELVAWPCLIAESDFSQDTVTLVMQCTDYKVSADKYWLTTIPPQRKPLTDEEILDAARNHYNPHQRAEISFARAIEAAHGIKE